MKNLIGSLLLVFLFSNPIFSQNQQLYTVQVGTFVDSKAADFEAIRPLGMVYAQSLDNNLYRVFLGGFEEVQRAEQVAMQLQQRGYNSASVVGISLDGNSTVLVIQFETLDAKTPIDWSKYESFDDLFAIIQEDVVKLVTGPYEDVDEAREDLEEVKYEGYSDAFIKRVNTGYLQRISTFETGIKQPLIPLSFDSQTQNGPVGGGEPITAGEMPSSSAAQPPATTPRSPVSSGEQVSAANTYRPETNQRSPAAKPDIRSNVKRESVRALQSVLQAENAYPGSIDGLYGSGTASAYQQALESNRDLQKYLVLASSMTLPSELAPKDRLQGAINNLMTDRKSQDIVNQSQQPVAKAYQAYLRFTSAGSSPTVNDLMNAAIQEAYRGANPQQAPFDYQATYAYKDLDQLLLHLFYVHLAPGAGYAAPCWLFERHEQQAASALQLASQKSDAELGLQGCDPFLEWNETRLTSAIAIDLDGSRQIPTEQLVEAASERARLYLATEPLPAEKASKVSAWNDRLWAGLDGWASIDPLHQRLVTALKIAFFQTQIRLEDYFMDKNFNADQARTMALATLQSLVGPHVERFE